MQRPVIEDVLDVLQEVRIARSKNTTLTALRLRQVAVQTVSSRELGKGRFANQASAIHSIQDACSRRLGGKIADFDGAIERFLVEDYTPLKMMLETVSMDSDQQIAVAQMFSEVQATSPIDSMFRASQAQESRPYEMQNVPSVEEYVRALSALGHRVTEEHRSLFRVHYEAKDRTATAKQLAEWARIPGGWTIVNSRYGRLGHALCDELDIKPQLRPDDTHRWWSVWSRGWSTKEGFVWQMLPNVAKALERLHWVSAALEFSLPDEVSGAMALVEGAKVRVEVNAYERNPEARRLCIAAHGSDCCICGLNFGAKYGPDAAGYIHVHHVRPLASIGGEYIVDPVADLRPVCPNCHAVLHRRNPAFDIEEVRRMLHRDPTAEQVDGADRSAC
jgi:5-methylcytosine-specific restriction protein A